MSFSVFGKARGNPAQGGSSIYFMANNNNRHFSNVMPRKFILSCGKVLTVCLENKMPAVKTAGGMRSKRPHEKTS